MRVGARQAGAVLVMAGALCLLGTSCTPEQKHHWLTVFFDGVPPLKKPGEATETVEKPTTATAPSTRAEARKPRWYEHEATADQSKCTSCHDPTRSFALVDSALVLCARCHEEDTREFPRMHGPVAVGHCIVCHEAHRSANEHLVRVTDSRLCLACHRRKAEDQPAATCTRPSDDEYCVECHHPHGGQDRYFLVQREDSGRPESEEGSPGSDEGP
ncbi:MAG: cytochrome c3 family protein [bacterium]